MASLQISKGGPLGEFPIKTDKIVLGRNPDCDVVITGTAVSRSHANILRQSGKYFIEDLKSRNGTFVNNEAIKGRHQLKDNDQIKICDFAASFHETSPSKPLPAGLRVDEMDVPDDPDETAPGASSPIEATFTHTSSKLIFDSQPADKLKNLLEITSNLSKTLELDSLMPRILDSLFQLFRQADRCFIILQDEGAKRLIPKAIKTRRSIDEANARFSRRIVNQCMETVQAILSDDASADSRFAMSQSIADFRIRSVMCAPLWTQDNVGFGVIQLDTQDRSKKFTQDDLKLLMAVAAQASVALENAKLHADLVARERLKRDLELAREVQRGFLPLKAPDIPGYEFFAHYESAYEVGGDYYDFVELPSRGQLAVTLGDVAGKGVPAALLMAKISSDARYCLLTRPNLADAISQLNTHLNQAAISDRFVTLAAAVLDRDTHTVTFVNAGHPSPLLHSSKSGKVVETTSNDITGLPLGVLEGFTYLSCQVTLQPGDSIVIFSDGVTEAMDVNNKQLGTSGIIDAIKPIKSGPRGLGEQLVKTCTQFATGRSQHDDLTLVCFGRTV